MSTFIEDTPAKAILRQWWYDECYRKFNAMDSSYGPWKNNSKTAITIQKDTINGRSALFNRIIWHRVLKYQDDIDIDNTLDPIFRAKIIVCSDVEQELRDAGRTEDQITNLFSMLDDQFDKAVTELSACTEAFIPNNIVLRNKTRDTYEIKYITEKGKRREYTISAGHLHKLRLLYNKYLQTISKAAIYANTDTKFQRRLFCVLARYHVLSAGAEGHQMAFPEAGFKWMSKYLDVDMECFASPLNCNYSKFCSVAPDTDFYFGGVNNFFKFNPELGGSFEANPPFVNSIMTKCVDHALEILSKAAPATFVIILPNWNECAAIENIYESRFLRHRMLLLKDEVKYYKGFQHEDEYKSEHSANITNDTLLFVLQNDAAVAKKSISAAQMKTLLEEVKKPPAGTKRFYAHNDPAVAHLAKKQKTVERTTIPSYFAPNYDRVQFDKSGNQLAIIIPFRDLDEKNHPRLTQLNTFITEMTGLLDQRREDRAYHFYIIEQEDDNRRFNRGKLLNIGYVIAKQDGCDTFAFHDVDLIPQGDLIQCYEKPAVNEMVPLGERFKRYTPHVNYQQSVHFFGGVNIFEAEGFASINGFPNNFWGWGGEDNEIGTRIKEKLNLKRVPPHIVGHLKDLEEIDAYPEKKIQLIGDEENTANDQRCNNRKELLDMHAATHKTNGLSNLRFSVLVTDTSNANCSRIKVDLLLNDEASDKFAYMNVDQTTFKI